MYHVKLYRVHLATDVKRTYNLSIVFGPVDHEIEILKQFKSYIKCANKKLLTNDMRVQLQAVK
jgi:hypothetical protein